jgi:hypothetical protein
MISLRMKATWLFIEILLTIVPSTAQNGATVGDFTMSRDEHIIIQLEKPFVVRSVKGVISREQGDQGPLPGLLFEIQGPGDDKKIWRATTDEHGRFKISRVAWGTYKFKTTLDGFQSVMGTITVSKNAAKHDEIKIEVPVGV